ncbi:MAG: alpha-glucan family phosphorylase [Rhodothermales bacterium]
MTTRQKLSALSRNLWWSWNPEALDLFRRLSPDTFLEAENNPIVALELASEDTLSDPVFIADVDEVFDAFEGYMEAEPRISDAPRVAYFCMEYGLHESLHTYSGGLGVLAGDHAKAASDLGIPFTAVGLLLRDGYFIQTFDEDGMQQARYVPLDPSKHPLHLVRQDDGSPLVVSVDIGHETLHVQAWRLDVGRTVMYLLDTDFDQNPEHLRGLTRRLYQGGRPVRIRQEVVLGIGGLRLIRALGLPIDVYHMNEGHCAFLTLELLREHLGTGLSRVDAEARVREQSVFTTHTPVMAGHDRFEPHLFLEVMWPMRDSLGLSDRDLLSLGRVNGDDDGEWFTMTVLGLNLARKSNGVSRLNGEVAREQWKELYPERPVEEVPIGSVTNGVHLPTWTAPLSRAFLNERLGDWLNNRFDPAFWDKIGSLPEEDLWALRNDLRGSLIQFVRERTAQQSFAQSVELDPGALTIGFARRFATYKRAPLLFHDLERAKRLFASFDRPIQILYAGKAHPADEGGKEFIRRILEISKHAPFRGKVVFLENYNMEIGRMLVSGCDVWMNNPRRPMEASGTSGQKIATHGGLNVSILDGWWPEGYDGNNGWSVGDELAEYRSEEEQDDSDARALYHVLEESVIPAFFTRDERGLPVEWVRRMRNAMSTLPYQFSAERMVQDYVNDVYRVALPQVAR